jgi:hypothetical protein
MQSLTLTRAITSVVLATLITATVTTVALAGRAAPTRVIPAKTLAERRVLGVLGRDWRPSRLREFIDARTRLPFDNVQATCRPRRGQTARPRRFVCVVRPRDRRSTVRLYLSYVSLRNGAFRVHWLDLRGR